jgi:hypothetical protein
MFRVACGERRGGTLMIVRRKLNSNFAGPPNDAIWVDDRLSVESKGTLGFLLSRPDNWNVPLANVGHVLNVGKDRLRRIFRELIAAKYVIRAQRRNAKGAFANVEYIVPDAAAIAGST